MPLGFGITHSCAPLIPSGWRPIITLTETRPVGVEAEHGYRGRVPSSHFAFEVGDAPAKVSRSDLSRRPGGRRDQVGYANAHIEQLVLVIRRQDGLGKPGGGQCFPKPVAGTGKMVADSSGPQARVDPAEQHPQPRANNVRKGRPAAAAKSSGVGRRSVVVAKCPSFLYLASICLCCGSAVPSDPYRGLATCYPKRWCRQS